MSSAPISVSTAAHRSDGLRQPVLGKRRVRDVQDEVGDERLLERGREALDELRRQTADESDRVRHEVALAVVLERARRRVERLEQAIVDRGVGSGERVQERRLPDVRVTGERDRRDARAPALLPARRALPREPAKPLLERARRAFVRGGGRSRAGSRPARASRRRRRAARGAATSPACAAGCTRAAPARPGASPPTLRACCAKMSRISCVRSTTRVFSASSSVRCCVGLSSSSTRSTSAAASAKACLSSVSFPLPDERSRCPGAPDAGRAHRSPRRPRCARAPRARRARGRRPSPSG